MSQCEGCGARRVDYLKGPACCAYCGSHMPGAENDRIDITHLGSDAPEYMEGSRMREGRLFLEQPTPQRR